MKSLGNFLPFQIQNKQSAREVFSGLSALNIHSSLYNCNRKISGYHSRSVVSFLTFSKISKNYPKHFSKPFWMFNGLWSLSELWSLEPVYRCWTKNLINWRSKMVKMRKNQEKNCWILTFFKHGKGKIVKMGPDLQWGSWGQILHGTSFWG